MKRLAGTIIVAVFAFVIYVVYTGSATGYDVVTGAIAAAISGLLFSGLVVRKPTKVLDPVRWAYLVKYALKYFTYYETLAHVDVIKRILHPKVPVNPAVVEAPFTAETDYAITAVANSITNTPGTIVIDLDEKRKVFYIHWIDATTVEPAEVRKIVFEDFERYAKKILD